MELLILIVFLIVGGIGVVFKALLTASQAKHKAALLEQRLNRLEEQWLNSRQVPPSPAPAEPSKTSPASAASGVATEEKPVPEDSPIVPPPETGSRPVKPPPLPVFPEPAQTGKESSKEFLVENFLKTVNWEQFMGVKLFAWLGGLALFLAVSFFIKYSFEQDLISPELRVMLGFAAGIGLLIGGIIMRSKDYKVTSQTLCGTGVVILYAVTFACRAVYHFPFFGIGTTFFLMVLITITAFLIAVRLDAMVVAILGMAGGFLTPVLLSTGQDHAIGLFSYIALLDLGLLGVAFFRRWNFLGLLAAIGTVLMQAGWFLSHYEASKIMTILVVFLGFDIMFLVACLWFARRNQGNKWLDGSTAGLIFVSLFTTLILAISEGSKPIHPHLITLLFGADICLLVLATARPRLYILEAISGLAAFSILSVWQMANLKMSLLPLAMGATVSFAFLHTGFPLLAARWSSATRPPSWWAHLMPGAALLLVALPLLQMNESSFLFWPVMFLLDLLAFGLAIISGSVLALLLVILLTVFNAAAWINRMPTDLTNLPESLLLIGAFAILLLAASVAAIRMTTGKTRWPRWAACLELPHSLQFGKDIHQHMPALSAGLPFLLLLMIVFRLPLPGPGPVFGLGLLLVGLMLGLTRYCKMPWLPLIALGGASLLQFAWQSHGVPWKAPGLNLAWHSIFYLSFLLFPFFFWQRNHRETHPWIASALAGPVHFLLIYALIKKAWPGHWIHDGMGLIPAAFALLTGLALLAVLRQGTSNSASSPASPHALPAWFGGVGLFFVTVIFPIQFERQWITLSWALEGAALLWLFRRVPHQGLQWVGLGLLQAAFIRLAFNPAVLHYHPRSETPILNWYLYAYGLVAACCFVATMLVAPPRHIIRNHDVRPWLHTMGTILLFLLVNIEIADFFTDTGSEALTFKFSGNFARDMSYSIAWALFSLALLMIGIARKLPPVRYAALGLLGVTLAKLFFHDLAHLGQLYRVGALVGVAIIAILASFLYQKYQVKPETED